MSKISEKEFKELFKLDEKCVIPEDTLEKYNLQIVGSYLLYKEILNIKDKKFKNVDGTELIAYFEEFGRGYQNFISTLGSRSKFRISYIDDIRGSNPFWARNKYEDHDECVKMKNNAYKLFESTILREIGYRYYKYGIKIHYRDFATTFDDYSRCHPNQGIWWDNLEFDSLYYYDENNIIQNFSSGYHISETITNRTSIWNGKILDPIKRVIDSLEMVKI